jgi:hypothetical protein
MNADEIVRVLRTYSQSLVGYKLGCEFAYAVEEAASLIESLQAQLAASQRRADAAVEDIMCNDRCDACMHKDSGTSCERVDFDCAECDDPVCVCRGCRDEDKWECRGNAE